MQRDSSQSSVPVPEPSRLLLSALGVGMICMRGRRSAYKCDVGQAPRVRAIAVQAVAADPKLP